MEDRIQLSYFYGKEAEQFSFYKIPKLLFIEEYFKKLSVEAKVLYGLMLDRMSLSMKNQWLDEEGRAYIYYSLEDIMDALGCSNKKAISIMKELDTEDGIGLIEKKRQGQGKPTMIYLKQFMVQDVQKCKNFTSNEKTVFPEVKKLHVLKCNSDMSRSEEITLPEVKKIHTNKNNINNTELSNTESNLIVSGDDGMRREMEAYAEIIRENIEIDILRERYPYEKELIDGIFDLILETVLCKNDVIIVASNRYPAELVRSKFLKLNSSHIEYELFGMHIKEKNDALSEDHPHVCIGWSKMGDISQIDSKEKLSELYEEHYDKNSRGRGQDVGQIWRFLRDMKVGDYVIYAENSVFHIGRVESDYYYDETETEDQDSDYRSTRKVKWLKKNISRSVLSTNLHNSLKTAMSIWTLNDYKSAVLDLLRGTYAKDGDIEMASEYIEPVYNTKLTTKFERNRIVFGAPGTGKSFGIKTDCENLMKGTEGTYERVTFHPDYTYSQFVGTYKPVMDADGTSIRYDFVPGPFMRVYVEAIKSGRTDAPQPHLLLIEEINRAKVAAVFGDVFQLLDRDDDGVSEYEIQASEDIRRYLAKELGGVPDNYKKIRIPNNMFIWATMNSADQGVFPMDTAFKRRWNFEYLGINESEEEIIGIGKIVLPGETEAVEWNTVRRAINDRMASEYRINEDKLMGPFFLAKKVIASDENGMIIDPEKFMEAFKSKVIMYLYEDAVKQRKMVIYMRYRK